MKDSFISNIREKLFLTCSFLVVESKLLTGLNNLASKPKAALWTLIRSYWMFCHRQMDEFV
ncbi:hypothetical protein Mapa_012220 [Marchantia paleacea]|nr:hypothetical protein Mapa_012220 [Marchantia paleacea]